MCYTYYFVTRKVILIIALPPTLQVQPQIPYNGDIPIAKTLYYHSHQGNSRLTSRYQALI